MPVAVAWRLAATGPPSTHRLQDPQTGEVFETRARDRYDFRVANAGRPTAIGTDTAFNPVPQIDLRRMMQVGVDVADR